jgi:N12 class adenine-specific DNA methylase/predicted RNA methylase
MAPRKKPAQDHSAQLGFDFAFEEQAEAQFTQTIVTIERVQAEAAADPEDLFEGVEHDRRTNQTAGTGQQVPAGIDPAGGIEDPVQPVRLGDSGSVGDELTAQTGRAGSAGGSGPAGQAAGTAEPRTGSTDGSLAGDGTARDAGDARDRVRAAVKPRNYTITAADRLGEGGAKAKFRDNLAALRTLQALDADARPATPEEQAILVRYVGWGGLPQAFDHQNSDWRSEFHALADLLPKREYEAARRSTQDAHYTPALAINTIYAGLQRVGFEGGKIGEPAAGTGHFIGLMPAPMRERSQITSVELDPLTARIHKHLYPEATIINKGFQDVTIPAGYFDAVVGNPPFGNQTVYDPAHRDLSDFSIHNYFIAKSLDKVRAGGVIGVIVSSYFMDAQGTAAREWIADRAHLLGAMRLPNTAFKQNALTEVTTDILFFQKAHEYEVTDKDWVNTELVADPYSDKSLSLNRYFVTHPDAILGEMTLTTSMHGDSPTCIEKPGVDLAAAMEQAVAQLPAGRYLAAQEQAAVAESDAIEVPEHVKVGAYFVARDRIARRLPDLLDDTNAEWVEPKNARAGERIKGMVEIRDTLRALMAAERTELASDAEVDAQRAKLNRAYDGFIKKHGFITALSNKQAFSDDPDYPLLLSLERDYDRGISKEIAARDGVAAREPSASKASIFHQRVIAARRDITHVSSPKDAMQVSLNEYGRVDVPYMMRLTGSSEDDLVRDLRGLIYLNPKSTTWESADLYLTGNVKQKLKEAEEAAQLDPRFAGNAEALRNVQPADIDPVDIGVQLGAAWVPPSVVDSFVGHLLGPVQRKISYQPSLGKWLVNIRPSNDLTTMTITWGTVDAPAHKLIEAILRNSPIQIKEETGRDERNNPIYTLNEEKTAVANQKADEIKQAFEDWVWEDKDRRELLGRIYNDTFNTNVAPTYDGSHLTLPGASLGVTLRPHQMDAIWRGVQDGGGLLDHRVGAGKTFVKVGIAMESRRMGLANKPMLAVPNHLLMQWKDAFYTLYPEAKVLVAEKTDFKKENREKLFARIATGDWDAVIVGHSSLKKIGMPAETLDKILSEQVDDLTEAVARLKSEQGDRLTIKQMEKARDRMQAKMERAADAGAKDKVVTFDELGVDQLLVDEIHEFKNLYINTSLTRVSGLGDLAGSDKAFDLFVKARYLQTKHNGRGVFGATGTPISNTIAEMYTVMRYMKYDEMKERGIEHFDSWASSFGKVVTGWELDATGVNYKLNSRFSKFQNVPELIALYRTFADVITAADLERQAMEQGKRFPVPKVKGGKPQNIIVERSELQARYMGVQEPLLDGEGKAFTREDGSIIKGWNRGSIIHRMEHLSPDPRVDNPLKITNDARKAGLDFRLIDPSAPDFEGSKVNELVRQVLRIHEAWKEQRGTQLIFCDLSTPSAKSAATPAPTLDERAQADNDAENEQDADEPVFSMDELLASTAKFSVYDDVRQKLIAHGVAPEEIRFIHEAKTDLQKAKLFAEVNEGRVRVLMGSTAKMGAGTNVQRKIVALHNLDAPWRPSDLEQREGRGIRQGNEFYEANPDGFEIEILRYATKQTYDSRMWQTIEVKAAGIEQFRKGDSLQRVIEDVAGEAANAAEMKAAATGNPLIFMQVQISADLKKMEAMYSNFRRNQHRLEDKIAWWEGSEGRAATALATIDADIRRRDSNTSDPWIFKGGKGTFNNESKEALAHLVMGSMQTAIELSPKVAGDKPRKVLVGHYRGFEVLVESFRIRDEPMIQFIVKGEKEATPRNLLYRAEDKFTIGGFISRLDNYAEGLSEYRQEVVERVGRDKEDLAKAQVTLAKPFPGLAKLEMLRQDGAEVMVELKKMQANDSYVSTWTPQSFDAAKAKQAPAEQQTMDLANDGGSAAIVTGLSDTAKAVLASPAAAFEKLPPADALKLHPSLEGAFLMLARAKQYAVQKFGDADDGDRFMAQTRQRIADGIREGKDYSQPENGRDR